MTRQHGLLALALIFAAIYLFPLYWMYITSVKTASEVFANPPTFWPHDPDLTVFATVWVRRSVPGFMWNSGVTVIASGVTAITVLLGTGLACVLARYRNMWVDVGLFAVLMLQVLPASVMVTPLFVVLVRATFLTVPRALKEAALVDGNSRPGAFFNIVLPLARNGVLVCAILTFMSAFGEYIYSKSIIQKTNLQPASVGPDLGGAEMTAQIALSGINKFFGGYHALRDIDLTIAKGGFVALVGPSGCGKSTLLRTIAGLESITSGSIHIAGHDVTTAPPRQRDSAMVFQSYALYPHMTVAENLTYALRLKLTPRAVMRQRAEEVAAITGLSNLLDRYPRELSGGQRQRVAMGRAIAPDRIHLFNRADGLSLRG